LKHREKKYRGLHLRNRRRNNFMQTLPCTRQCRKNTSFPLKSIAGEAKELHHP